jgi:hypothetical protein
MSRVSTIKFRGWLLATTHIGNDGALLLEKILVILLRIRGVTRFLNLSYLPSDKGGNSVFFTILVILLRIRGGNSVFKI